MNEVEAPLGVHPAGAATNCPWVAATLSPARRSCRSTFAEPFVNAEPPPLLTWTVYSVYLSIAPTELGAPSEWLTFSTSSIEMQM